MSGKQRRSFSAEFKADTVRLCAAGDRSIGQVCKDLGLTESAVRRWIEKAPKAGTAGSGGLTTTEREELNRLRRENKRLVMEREILKKAAAFFAKESE
jgi:transposase-like protein